MVKNAQPKISSSVKGPKPPQDSNISTKQLLYASKKGTTNNAKAIIMPMIHPARIIANAFLKLPTRYPQKKLRTNGNSNKLPQAKIGKDNPIKKKQTRNTAYKLARKLSAKISAGHSILGFFEILSGAMPYFVGISSVIMRYRSIASKIVPVKNRRRRYG
jgi:hypothetical protein